MSSPVRSALLIIDMQYGLYHAPDKPWQREQLLANIGSLVTRARRTGTLLLAARHTGPADSPIAAGSPLWQLLPELALEQNDAIIFNKTRPSCFQGTELAALLAQHDIQRLIICGMKTQYCVDSTVRAAAERGLQCVLVADAHSCADTPQLPASQIVAHHNATLAAFASIQPASEIQF
ncbi:cysteine hydrolase family protein [Vogesella sp. LIG4]|uniref:cysteine hydrolase family protein n=1 Tax=Vogesella sp. LIG4 TaxID=1192162 RepID=UPI00081F8261|nr:cysteine hydrolase family protein [Vogesella sp. LIG4]SCK12676.1 Nicotinamidase-related amidase [Vogesella sp. LIG4]